MQLKPHPSIFSSLIVTVAISLLLGVIYLIGHFYNLGQSAESAVTSAARLTGYGTTRPVPDILADLKKAQAELKVEQAKLDRLQTVVGGEASYSPTVILNEQSKIDFALQSFASNQTGNSSKLSAMNVKRGQALEALNAWKALTSVPPAQQNAQAVSAAAQNYAEAASQYVQSINNYIDSLPPGTNPQTTVTLENEITVLQDIIDTINSSPTNPSGPNNPENPTSNQPSSPSNSPTPQQIQDQQNVIDDIQDEIDDLETELSQTQNPPAGPGQNQSQPTSTPTGNNQGNPSNPGTPGANPILDASCLDTEGTPCLIQGANIEY